QETGASIFIKDGIALIKGTDSQRAQAKSLIQETLNKESHQVYPEIGYVLLEIDNESMEIDDDIKQSKIRFREYCGQDSNIHSRNRITYYLDHIVAKKNEKGKSPENDGDFDLTSGIANLSLLNDLSSRSQAFNTTNIIQHCLDEISTLLHKSDPSQIETKINIFFGRQLFSNIVDKEISINDWCAMDRSRI
ncbi:6414_t:CDS:1, partial [Ambispora leptoticha]